MIVFQFLPQVEVMRSSLTAFPNARKGIEKMTQCNIYNEVQVVWKMCQNTVSCG